jgi:hypothetical protein
MQTIIAGRFEQQSDSDHAVRELIRAGYESRHISSFYLNPPGRHDIYPIGGDENSDSGAKQAPAGLAAGTVAGGTIGAAIGAATLPVTGPLGAIAGAFVGAHIGNITGSLNAMEDDGASNTPTPRGRHWGMMVAVGVDNDDAESSAIDLLRSLGATDIERAEGTIENGDWSDFDPISTPHFTEQGGAHPR